MWWLLIITLWSSIQAEPYALKPVVLPSEAACTAAGQKFTQDVAGNKPPGLAAMSWGCAPVSNPMTEKQASGGQ